MLGRTSTIVAVILGLWLALPAFAAEAPAVALPRLVDLGAGKCIPCKKMAPILEELKKDYAGIVDVIFVDVWKDPKAGVPYGIRVIPTQVFMDPKGKEVLRHEGFFSREEIEKVFQEKLGVKPIPAPKKEGDQKTPSEGPVKPEAPGMNDPDRGRQIRPGVVGAVLWEWVNSADPAETDSSLLSQESQGSQ